jgi:EAL domain-containing protein (putative c-di-GMP-specific phosphodiesterase class I)
MLHNSSPTNDSADPAEQDPSSAPGAARTPDTPARILVVDDDELVASAMRRLLERPGLQVVTAANGAEAVRRLRAESFDIVLSDVRMPVMDGIGLLRAIRQQDQDMPVILMTGAPSIHAASAAVEHGALGYLVKPVETRQLRAMISRGLQLRRVSQLRRKALEVVEAAGQPIADLAGLRARLDLALESLWIAYQPIVNWPARSVFAYEALVRSDEPSLRQPLSLLDAGERLDRIDEIGRHVRRKIAAALAVAPRSTTMFVNLHASDLRDEAFLSGADPLSQFARQVVLEITERAALDDVHEVPARIRRLKSMGYRVAVDDLGAGYAGLNSFALLEPDIVKLDMCLVRDVDAAPVKRRLLQGLIEACRDLGIRVVAEGVETLAERDTLLALGGELLQGYLFAGPDRAFPEARL